MGGGRAVPSLQVAALATPVIRCPSSAQGAPRGELAAHTALSITSPSPGPEGSKWEGARRAGWSLTQPGGVPLADASARPLPVPRKDGVTVNKAAEEGLPRPQEWVGEQLGNLPPLQIQDWGGLLDFLLG